MASTPKPKQEAHAVEVALDAVMPTGGEHVYISTACAHGRHRTCGQGQFARRDLTPPHCKYCTAVCACADCDHVNDASNPASPLGMLLARPGPPERRVIS